MLGRRLTHEELKTLAAAARGKDKPWLLFDEETFRESYNRRPFVVRHRLAEDPHFTFDALFDLCRRLPPNQIKVRVGKVPVDTDFDASLAAYNAGLTLEDAIAGFEEREAYICINNPERDPAYRAVIEGLVGEIAAQTEPIEPGLNWYSTYVFMSAQDAITPYHMDREMNFLLQVQGTKLVKLWDPGDDEIMSPEEKDRLLAQFDHQRPQYRESFERKAMRFELAPGLGVHHPFIAPHLVTTLANRSISLAITFRTERSDIWSDAHRFNHHLRRLGLTPAPVGQNLSRDTAKARALRLARSARGALRQHETA